MGKWCAWFMNRAPCFFPCWSINLMNYSYHTCPSCLFPCSSCCISLIAAFCTNCHVWWDLIHVHERSFAGVSRWIPLADFTCISEIMCRVTDGGECKEYHYHSHWPTSYLLPKGGHCSGYLWHPQRRPPLWRVFRSGGHNYSGKFDQILLWKLTLTIINPSAWGHLNPSSYCDVGRLFYGVFKL